MLADNQRCESPVAEKLPENSQWVEASQQLPALPNPPAPIPETSKRVFDPIFAAQIGLLEAIFICQLHYWLTNPKAGYHKGGVKWIYNGYKEWLVQLPFIKSVDILGRIIRKLERMGLIETGNFNNNPYDRRKWYRIIYEELARKYGWNPLNLPILQESRMDNAARQNGLCTNTESYTDYPQNYPQKNNNIGDDAFLKNGKEKSVTSTVTVNESVEVKYESSTEIRASTPETTTTTVEEPSSNEVPQNIISEEPSKPPQQTPSSNCTGNYPYTVKPKKRKKTQKIDNPDEDNITEELGKAGLLSPKLKSLALKYSLEAVQKTIAMLNQQSNTVKNPSGWFTQCLKKQWWKQIQQPQRQRKKKAQAKSWETEFNPWYAWAISEGIVEDVNVRYLSANQFGEPYVRLAIPDRFLSIPYTVEHWRTAQKQFPMPDGALEKLYSSLPTDDPPPTDEGDSVQNRPVEKDDGLASGEFVDSSPGGVFRESSPDRSPESPSCVAQNRLVESITPNNLSGSPPETSPGSVSQNLDPDDFGTQPSSVSHTWTVEAVNENDLSGSPPDISSGDVSGELSPGEFSAQPSHLTQNHSTESITEDSSLNSPPDAPPGGVSRKVALDFSGPDWMTFPWEPENGWQPGAERERSRRHKAEWCRNQLIRVSSHEELHTLFEHLGDCALVCLEWVERHLLTPQEIASYNARIDASCHCEQQSLFE